MSKQRQSALRFEEPGIERGRESKQKKGMRGETTVRRPRVEGQYSGNAEDLRVDLVPIQELLLAVRGYRLQRLGYVKRHFDPLEAEIFEGLGAFFPGNTATLKRGQGSACHQNSAQLDDGQTSRRFTGFALSGDGCWQIHSWVMTPDGIIETTEPRILYFGIRRPARSPRKQPSTSPRAAAVKPTRM